MGKNILIVGVGGQGTLLASKIMGAAFLSAGYDVKVGEVHGMSQRGGSVVTYVKYADKVYSPIIDKGEADVILSFEPLEAARWLPYLKKGGSVITGLDRIDPMPVIAGKAEYPEGIIEKIAALGIDITALDARALALEAGSVKAVNTVLLGLCAAYLDLDKKLWEDALTESVPQKTVEVNLKAFELGYSSRRSNI